MVPTSRHALGSTQIHEQLCDNSDSFSGISLDSDVNIIEHSHP
jgi:hypothetical protein